MKKLTALAVAIVAALSAVAAALAITNGELDGNAHPNVGAFLVQRPAGWRVLCTGSLVAPRVFLTASHCTSYADEQGWTVGVTFQSTDAENPATVLGGHTVTNPLYHAPYAHDVSIIVLDEAQPGPYVPLPRVGLLDDLKKAGALDSADFLNVGYGTHEAGQRAGEARTSRSTATAGGRCRRTARSTRTSSICTRRTTRTKAARATATPVVRRC